MKVNHFKIRTHLMLINSWEAQKLNWPTKCHPKSFCVLHLVRTGWEMQKTSSGQVNEACREGLNMWHDPRWLHVSSLFFSQQKLFIIPQLEDQPPSVSAVSFLNLMWTANRFTWFKFDSGTILNSKWLNPFWFTMRFNFDSWFDSVF